MPVRALPVRPDLDQLHRQAKDLLRAIHAGDTQAIAELREHHPDSIDPAAAKLADAHLVLARSYRASANFAAAGSIESGWCSRNSAIASVSPAWMARRRSLA